ncbi:MAG: hypothetical protein M1838_003178 [Thelocarpon superellum]|nr:MAG: hypothetical protein M1838_003178 [Thelocarpon superellum]
MVSTATNASVADQLAQLDKARKLVLGDAAYYPQIVQGILPIVGTGARVELRRWGVDFLAETFASPTLPTPEKESLGLQVLETLVAALQSPEEDTEVLKSVVQVASSIYPFIFRHIIAHPTETASWEQMSSIKSKILKMWDTAAVGIRVCCIKFVQRVIHVQTPGTIADPRRPEQNEISLALVPRTHPIIPPPNLEAEASGLLDRLLNVFLEEASDAIVVNATLNSLALLIRTRPAIANKIISALLNFNPLKQANASMTPKLRVAIRSMERTTRALMVNINKQNPSGPLAGRIQQYLERLVRLRIDIFDDAHRKRPAPSEPTDGLDSSKRARLGAARLSVPSLPPGPTSYAQLYTITDDEALSSFDVQQLPAEMVVQITLTVLRRLDKGLLEEATKGIQLRWQSVSQQQRQAAANGAFSGVTGVDDDDDEYEPDFEPAEDDEQIMNKLDDEPSGTSALTALRPFKLGPAPVMSEEESSRLGQGTIARVFGVMNTLEVPSAAKARRVGFNRLAASSYDRDAWTTLITRLATRTTAGLDDGAVPVKLEGVDAMARMRVPALSQSIREALYLHIVEDFRTRIPTAIAWLNEEWYNDRVSSKGTEEVAPSYEKWVLKVLDGMLPYLDAKDKVFTRFLSEIPGINPAILERVTGLARDPERVGLAVNTLHYLVLLRPPARDLALDALQDLWEHYEDARPSAAKVLIKWRPHLFPSAISPATTDREDATLRPATSMPATNGVAAAS